MLFAKFGAEMVASEPELSLVSVRRARCYVVFPVAIAGMPSPVCVGALDDSLSRFFADSKMAATDLDGGVEELAMRLVWEEVRVGSLVRFDARAEKNLFNVKLNRFHRLGRVFGEPPAGAVRDPNVILAKVLATMDRHRLEFVDGAYSSQLASGLLGWWTS